MYRCSRGEGRWAVVAISVEAPVFIVIGHSCSGGCGFDSHCRPDSFLRFNFWRIMHGKVGSLVFSWSWTRQPGFIFFSCLWIQLCNNIWQSKQIVICWFLSSSGATNEPNSVLMLRHHSWHCFNSLERLNLATSEIQRFLGSSIMMIPKRHLWISTKLGTAALGQSIMYVVQLFKQATSIL